MRRIRQTYGVADYSEIAELWLKQTQLEARTRPALSRQGVWLAEGRMWFKGRIIYSYGTHFPIARILDDGAVLFTNQTFPCPMRSDGRKSPTTRTHIEHVKGACRRAGRKIIYCEYVNDPEHIRNVLAFISDLDGLYRNVLKHRQEPVMEDVMAHIPGTEYTWISRRSYDSSFLSLLKPLYAYIGHFRLRTKFRVELLDYVRGVMTPEEVARCLVDEIVRKRAVLKAEKQKAVRLCRNEKARVRMLKLRKQREKQRILEEKRLYGKVASMERIEEIYKAAAQSDNELFGLPAHREVGSHRGLSVLQYL